MPSFTNLTLNGPLQLGTKITQYPAQLQKSIDSPDSLTDSEFSTGVVLDGNTAFISSPGADVGGAVYRYSRQGADWVLVDFPVPTDIQAGDMYGYSLALYQDYLIVGAPGSGGAGAIYVFKNSQSQWLEITKISLPDGVTGDQFGFCIGMVDTHLFVGAPGYQGTGAVFIYNLYTDIWQNVYTLTGSELSQNFGTALSVISNTLLIGASNTNNIGSAYLYKLTLGWTLSHTFVPVSTDTGQQFGRSVSISGNKIAIGGNSGFVSTYINTSTGWQATDILTNYGVDFGYSVSLCNDMLAIGQPGIGIVFLYKWEEQQWSQRIYVDDPDPSPGRTYGISVFLLNSTLIVGSAGGSASGHAYIYVPVSPPAPTSIPVPVPNPIILSTYPSEASGTPQVVIFGNDFIDVQGITFNDLPVTSMLQLNLSSIAVTIPVLDPGFAVIKIFTAYGQAENSYAFRYIGVDLPGAGYWDDYSKWDDTLDWVD